MNISPNGRPEPPASGHATLTIDASQGMGLVKKFFHGINVTFFIREAERRAMAAKA
jgi:hypothetical protein